MIQLDKTIWVQTTVQTTTYLLFEQFFIALGFKNMGVFFHTCNVYKLGIQNSLLGTVDFPDRKAIQEIVKKNGI